MDNIIIIGAIWKQCTVCSFDDKSYDFTVYNILDIFDDSMMVAHRTHNAHKHCRMKHTIHAIALEQTDGAKRSAATSTDITIKLNAAFAKVYRGRLCRDDRKHNTQTI